MSSNLLTQLIFLGFALLRADPLLKRPQGNPCKK